MRPGTLPGPVRQRDDELDEASRRAQLEDRKNSRMSKISKLLSANWYITSWTHPCLDYGGRQLSVSEYYPELQIAVDKFYRAGAVDEKEIDYKRKALRKQGIKYGKLTPDKATLADLYVDLELGD